ncbi:unnamed protein product [Vitrella brassicaformis CCMP3155]|uniref:U2A'/phosphoprotein 32 family A C-terminal domain-containing protein n=2 Tax=Vitrella brassicaformis TaxID=1169539 RepID=A0A0G4EX36_VITBC|nr:unnamed protein product [Vitrella brassicaformis CCMP3155]|eukprot:CEM03231.1 unnamed protein product [Vitrella brassicaformis CCMP3155]
MCKSGQAASGKQIVHKIDTWLQTRTHCRGLADNHRDSEGGLSVEEQSLAWSSGAAKLREMANTMGSANPLLCSEAFLLHYFNDLCFRGCHIVEMDSFLSSFQNLKTLNLSQNRIRVIRHLPPKLELLDIYGNEIASISNGLKCPAPSLLHLGMGSNCVVEAGIQGIAAIFPNLISLDLSFNLLADSCVTLEYLSGLTQLCHLYLLGNPLTLHPHYRMCSIVMMPSLMQLEEAPVTAAEKEAAVAMFFPSMVGRKLETIDREKLPPMVLPNEWEVPFRIEISKIGGLKKLVTHLLKRRAKEEADHAEKERKLKALKAPVPSSEQQEAEALGEENEESKQQQQEEQAPPAEDGAASLDEKAKALLEATLFRWELSVPDAVKLPQDEPATGAPEGEDEAQAVPKAPRPIFRRDMDESRDTTSELWLLGENTFQLELPADEGQPDFVLDPPHQLHFTALVDTSDGRRLSLRNYLMCGCRLRLVMEPPAPEAVEEGDEQQKENGEEKPADAPAAEETPEQRRDRIFAATHVPLDSLIARSFPPSRSLGDQPPESTTGVLQQPLCPGDSEDVAELIAPRPKERTRHVAGSGAVWVCGTMWSAVERQEEDGNEE